jgi:hypothetical protein
VTQQFGGTREITQGKTKNVAGGKMQPGAGQHCAIIFLNFVLLFL